MVSIVIPAYNVSSYLGACIDSAISQTYADIEIIVVDDGSTDDTGKVAAERAARDSRVRLIRRENGGLSAARNTGIEASSGEWLMFLDGDDMLAPDAVDTLLTLARQTGADIACGDYTRRLPFEQPKSIRTMVLTGRQALADVLYQSNIEPSAWGKLYRRTIFNTLRYREGILYEDLDIAPAVFEQAATVANTRRVVCYYRPNPKSILNTFNPRRFDVLDVTRRIEDRMRHNAVELLGAARDRRLSASFNIMGLLEAYGLSNKYASVADDCHAYIRQWRRRSLADPNVRVKNKCGILLSYTGRKLTAMVLARHYRRKMLLEPVRQ